MELEYFLYDDDECSQYIKTNFSSDVLTSYNTLIPGAYRADLWRYCILYKYGGIYLDIDSEILKTLAHEMVHIKQFAKGQLKRIGRQTFWMGKRYVRSKVNYYDHPWEHDAWSKEKFLSAKIFKILSKENEKFERSQRKS